MTEMTMVKRCTVVVVVLLALVIVLAGAVTMPTPAAVDLDWMILNATPQTPVGPLP